jgi:hypothetical protein
VTAPQQQQVSAAQLALIIALVDTQSRMRLQLSQAAVQAAVAAFRALRDWWDADQVDRAIRQALRVVQASQRQAARLTDAYLARVATILTGRTVRPAGAVDIERLRRSIPDQVVRDLVDGRRAPQVLLLGEHDPARRRVVPAPTLQAEQRLVIPDPGRRERGGPPAELLTSAAAYGRIADQYRYQVVGNGDTEESARAKALVRVEVVAHTDVTLAVREQVRKSLDQVRGVTGYRRILRPELSQTGPCGLCVVAADRKYKVENLMPLHDNCVCEVLPIIGEFDPGLNLNASDLRRIYEAAGGTGGEVRRGGRRHSGALKQIRVALGEHGELGPVLFDADQNFRGPSEVARTMHPDRDVRDQAKLDAFEERLTVLIRRQARGEPGLDRAIEWQTDRIDRLRRSLDRQPVAA